MIDPMLMLARRLNHAALALLAVGLSSALFILASAAHDEPAALGVEIVNGVAYPVKPEEDRMAAYQIERLGGKMGLFMVEFDEWFSGLWKGRTLAYTIAALTVAMAGALAYVAREVRLDALAAQDDGAGGSMEP